MLIRLPQDFISLNVLAGNKYLCRHLAGVYHINGSYHSENPAGRPGIQTLALDLPHPGPTRSPPSNPFTSQQDPTSLSSLSSNTPKAAR